MSFKECLENYMKDKTSDEDLKFIADIHNEYNKEIEELSNNSKEKEEEIRKQERERLKSEIFGTYSDNSKNKNPENNQTINVTIDDLFKNIK